MGWLSKLFKSGGVAPTNDPVERLAAALASNIDGVFLPALTEAVAYGPQGIDTGVKAMEEAMRRRAGDRNIAFMEVRLGTLTSRDPKVALTAPEAIVELARKGALLRDPRVSQDLLSACLSYHGMDTIKDCLFRAKDVGGVDQFFSLQLLYNHLGQAAKLAHARGGRSWTEQMTGKVSEPPQ